MELGIALDLSEPGVSTGTWDELARLAEERGLALVVLTASDGRESVTEGGGAAASGEPSGEGAAAEQLATAGLDPWTAATWLAGRTSSIGIGVPLPDLRAESSHDAVTPYPMVVAKAGESFDLLAPGRLLTDAAAWVHAPRGASAEELSVLAGQGRPVVVPVDSEQEVRRLADLVSGAPRVVRPQRSLAVRARRRPGIDYESVPESLAGLAVEPGDPGYRGVASNYLRAGSPGLVLRPGTPDEVADALGYARRHTHLPLGIRSAGHGVSGRSTNKGGLVVDLRRMNGIEVLDPARRLVRIGPGATWKQVSAALHPHGWAIGSGDYGGVGVGGLATAGGIGLLGRAHGLTIDHLRAVELVLADGSQVRASADEHPELFWAFRGAGANFGVGTAFEFEADRIGQVGHAELTFVTTDIEKSLADYGRIASEAPRDTTVFLVTGRPRQGQWTVQLFGVVDNPDPEVIVERLTPFAQIGLLAQQQVVVTPYMGVMGSAADVGPEGHQGFGQPVSRSAFLPRLTPEFARDAADLLRSGRVYFFELRAMGGAIADVPSGEMAFPHRASAFQVTAMGANDGSINQVWDPLRHHFDGLYLSFETDPRPERLHDAFPPAVLERLREIKRHYDPNNLFRDNFNIDPHPDARTAPSGAVKS
ncbi:FAD-linked oxidase [Streptomyces sp. AS58]|uniref:FAD-binding oxidoreductase n=1 Tax=Streptomyces sp. AS58 TaxID=1519489 RepID=UPI0006B01DCC|nr:FAD-binding oxidoreductase [Streptomyces sp. AS58]KOV69936.1 FAD-linked oxidase [Streptomyces sp. AS58]